MLLIEATEQPRGLRLWGDLDLSGADTLAHALEHAVDHPGSLHLDLSGVGFLDSIGLAVLIRAALSLEGRGTLVLRGVAPQVRRVLELSGTLRIPNVRVLD
jgi:anti-anti-sigma factor